MGWGDDIGLLDTERTLAFINRCEAIGGVLAEEELDLIYFKRITQVSC